MGATPGKMQARPRRKARLAALLYHGLRSGMRIALACLAAATLTACVPAQPASHPVAIANAGTPADDDVDCGPLIIRCHESIYFLIFYD